MICSVDNHRLSVEHSIYFILDITILARGSYSKIEIILNAMIFTGFVSIIIIWHSYFLFHIQIVNSLFIQIHSVDSNWNCCETNFLVNFIRLFGIFVFDNFCWCTDWDGYMFTLLLYHMSHPNPFYAPLNKKIFISRMESFLSEIKKRIFF